MRVGPADFFKTVPEGGDVYVLAQILHDWPDHDALEILRVCAAAAEYEALLEASGFTGTVVKDTSVALWSVVEATKVPS